MAFKTQLNTDFINEKTFVFNGFKPYSRLQWKYLPICVQMCFKNIPKMHLNGSIVSNIKKASIIVNAFIFGLFLDFFIFSI